MKWIISDIHGCFNTLLALIEKVKKEDENAEFIFVGDFVDRGDKSKEVLEYLIPKLKSGEYMAVQGNHEGIMYDGIYHPFGSNWGSNGGGATIKSYNNNKELMEEHIDFITTLPYYLIFDDVDEKGRKLLVTHSFFSDYIDEYLSLYGGTEDEIYSAVQKYEEEFGIFARCKITKMADLINWNRNITTKGSKNYFNVCGHNITGHLLEKYDNINGYNEKTEVIIDNELGYACIDTGAFIDWQYENIMFGGKLTAISFPNKDIIQQENIDG